MKPEQYPTQDGRNPDLDADLEDTAGGGKAIDRTWEKLRDADDGESNGSMSGMDTQEELDSEENEDFPLGKGDPRDQRYSDRGSDLSLTDEGEEVAGDDPVEGNPSLGGRSAWPS